MDYLHNGDNDLEKVLPDKNRVWHAEENLEGLLLRH